MNIFTFNNNFSKLQSSIIWLVVVGLIAGLGYKFIPHQRTRTLGNTNIVTIDLLWLANSQHAAAASLIGLRQGQDGQGAEQLSQEEASLALIHTTKRVRGVIRQIAGKGTIIFVRQAVPFNDGLIPDITQQVLEALELPINVPHEAENAYDGSPDTGVTKEELRKSIAAAESNAYRLEQAQTERSDTEADRQTGRILP